MTTYTVVSKDAEVQELKHVRVKKEFSTYNVLTLAEIDEKIQALSDRIMSDTAAKASLEDIRWQVELEAKKVFLK